ncbi:MAG: tyrosine-protein phosphatase, partial [Lentisphaeria bacterium]|nr:tyrosine-protein phosphatase [Lentisphaeria bacterium]
LLTGWADSLPKRNYLGMTRSEVAAVLEESAFRSRWSGNRFMIEDGDTDIRRLHPSSQDVLNDEQLMECPQWQCDFFPERHWLLGWSGRFAKWHFQTLVFDNDIVVRQIERQECYRVYGQSGESPYPKHPKNFHQVNQEIYRSGQPDANEMASLHTFEGIQSVLNLRENHDDRGEIRQLPVELFEIPMAAGSISEAELVTILRTIKNAPKPMLIHCWHGSDRTGAAVAAYRIVFENWDVEKAVSELMDKKYGHHRTIYKNIPELLRKADWDTIRKATMAPERP